MRVGFYKVNLVHTLKKILYDKSTMFAVEILLMVSWVTYCIPYDSYSGRLSPLVVVLLALVNTLLGNEDPSINWSSDIFIMSSIVQVAFVIGAYSYILVKTKIIQDRITSPVNQEVYIKQQISNVARKTDNICLGISMGLNFVTVICYVTFCSI